MMPEGVTVQELLERGLHYYGQGEVGKALQMWHEVLALDPDNKEAREYIQIETGRPEDTEPAETAQDIIELEEEIAAENPEEEPVELPPGTDLFFSGQESLLSERWFEAEQAFLTAHQVDPTNPLYWAHVELTRAQVIKDTVEKIGDLHRVPRLLKTMKQLEAMSFTQEEGFILSLINGEISFEDIIAISPVPRYITYRTLLRLLRDSLITMAEV
jgi:tetratricopeptide (TPR) repeat protein